MKLKKYRDVLMMAKEAVDASLAPVRAHRAKKQAELEIAKMEERMASQDAKISEVCSAKEINFDALIAAMDNYGLMERRLKQFQKIIQEMFPNE